MPYPKSALSPPEPKLKTQAQMMALLKERSAAQGKLVWLPPVKATQRTQDGRYELRGTKLKDALMYYAWSLQSPVPKLLGYHHDAQLARNFCESHHLGGTA